MQRRRYSRLPPPGRHRGRLRCPTERRGASARHHDHDQPRAARRALRAHPQPPRLRRRPLGRAGGDQGLRQGRAARQRVQRRLPLAGGHRLGRGGGPRELRSDDAGPRPDGIGQAPPWRSRAGARRERGRAAIPRSRVDDRGTLPTWPRRLRGAAGQARRGGERPGA